HEHAPHLFRCLDNLGRFPRVEGHGFFEQHVFARPQGVDGDPRVQIVWYGNGHRVDVRLVQQIVIIRVSAGDLEAVGGLFEAFGIRLGYGDRCCAGTMQEAVEMIEAERACSNHRTTKSFRHIGWGTTCWLWLMDSLYAFQISWSI